MEAINENGSLKLERDPVGMELQRLLVGGVSRSWKRDVTGKPLEHRVETEKKIYRHKQYQWQVNDRLKSVTDLLKRGTVQVEHDLFGNLSAASIRNAVIEINALSEPNPPPKKFSLPFMESLQRMHPPYEHQLNQLFNHTSSPTRALSTTFNPARQQQRGRQNKNQHYFSNQPIV